MKGWIRLHTASCVVIGIVVATSSAQAQQRGHYHDAAGHMIDRNGHHIDAYGRHTGRVGVSHNQYGGQYVTQQPNYAQGYATQGPTIGGYYGAAPVVSPNVGAYVIPQNVVPYQAQNASVGTGAIIRIVNPADSGGDVNYMLNGTPQTIKAGSTQTLQNDRLWTLEFGSGGPAGNLRYSLYNGTYKFKVTETGWNLFKSQDQAAVNTIPPAPIPQPDVNGPRPGIVPVN